MLMHDSILSSRKLMETLIANNNKKQSSATQNSSMSKTDRPLRYVQCINYYYFRLPSAWMRCYCNAELVHWSLIIEWLTGYSRFKNINVPNNGFFVMRSLCLTQERTKRRQHAHTNHVNIILLCMAHHISHCELMWPAKLPLPTHFMHIAQTNKQTNKYSSGRERKNNAHNNTGTSQFQLTKIKLRLVLLFIFPSISSFSTSDFNQKIEIGAPAVHRMSKPAKKLENDTQEQPAFLFIFFLFLFSVVVFCTSLHFYRSFSHFLAFSPSLMAYSH